MPKSFIDAVPDAALDQVALANQLDIVSNTALPTDLSNSLASIAITPGDGNGDFVIADDPSGGRRLTLAAQGGIVTTAAGTPRHVVLSLSGSIIAVFEASGDDTIFPGTTNTTDFYFRQPDPI